ncbi:unnamed protein product [Calypogeia fissa]
MESTLAAALGPVWPYYEDSADGSLSGFRVEKERRNIRSKVPKSVLVEIHLHTQSSKRRRFSEGVLEF